MKRNWLILFALVLMVFAPPIALGYFHLSRAQTTPKESEKAAEYEKAAQLLPWRTDLYEKAALAEGNGPQAIAFFETAIQKKALSPTGQLRLGDAYLQAGETEQALAEWENLLNEGQATGDVSPRLVKAYHARGQYADEERVLRQWLTFNPTEVEANQRLGVLLAASASPEALPLLIYATSASPAAAARYRGLLTALKTSDAAPAYQLTLTGQALANLDEWPLALSAFERATRAEAAYAPAWAWLGLARQRLGQPEAQAAFEQAIALDGNSAPIRGMLGLYWEQHNDLTQAEAQYQQAARLEPQNPAWQLALAGVIGRRDLPTALEYYQRAIRLDEENAPAWFALAAFCVENDAYLQDYGLDAALRAYALDPENPQYLDLLGRALSASGEAESAERIFTKAIQALPQAPAPVFHLALLYLQNNQPGAAQARLLETIQLDPNGAYGAQAKDLLERYFR